MDADEKWRLIAAVASSLTHGSQGLKTFVDGFRRVLETEAWRTYPYPNGGAMEFDSVVEFIEHPRGLNSEVRQVERLIADDPDLLVAFRRAAISPRGRPSEGREKSDNITTSSGGRGTARAYQLDRLQREAPDFYEKVKVGELSVNRAMIESGLKRPTVSIPRNIEVDDLATVLKRRYNSDQLALLRKLLDSEE